MEGQTFLPLICYEAIFPDELSYTGRKVTAIVNVTNDAGMATRRDLTSISDRHRCVRLNKAFRWCVQQIMVFQQSSMPMVES